MLGPESVAAVCVLAVGLISFLLGMAVGALVMSRHESEQDRLTRVCLDIARHSPVYHDSPMAQSDLDALSRKATIKITEARDA